DWRERICLTIPRLPSVCCVNCGRLYAACGQHIPVFPSPVSDFHAHPSLIFFDSAVPSGDSGTNRNAGRLTVTGEVAVVNSQIILGFCEIREKKPKKISCFT